MKLLIATIAMVLGLLVVLGGVQAYRTVGRVCPACGTAGGQADESGEKQPSVLSTDVTAFAFLMPEPVNPLWCPNCGHKWRIVKG